MTHRTKSGAKKQVDFLSGVVGLTTKDLARRAIEPPQVRWPQIVAQVGATRESLRKLWSKSIRPAT